MNFKANISRMRENSFAKALLFCPQRKVVWDSLLKIIAGLNVLMRDIKCSHGSRLVSPSKANLQES